MKDNLTAIAEKFAQRDRRGTNLNNARVTACELWTVGDRRFNELAKDLRTAIGAPGTGRNVFADSADPDDVKRRGWHRWAILRTAERLDYFADIRDFMCWVRVGLVTESGRSDILLSLHTIGPGFSGLCGASLCFYRREIDEEGNGLVTHLQPATSEPFEIHFNDKLEPVTRQFNRWLDDGLNRAVTIWTDSE